MSQIDIQAEELFASISGYPALRGATVTLHSGEVHGIVGPNGSGKSTLLHLISGFKKKNARSSGRLLICGKDVLSFYDREIAKANRIYLVPQEPPIVDGLSILDNVFLGNEHSHHSARLDRNYAEEKLNERLHALGLNWKLSPYEMCATLPISDRQKVALIRVLMHDPKPSFIFFDEPTTNLGAEETASFLKMLKVLAGEGIGIVLVSHRFQDILEACDRISVMSDGRVSGTYYSSKITVEDLHRLVFGYLPTSKKQALSNGSGQPVLSVNVKRLMDRQGQLKVKDFGFEVRAGEVLGVFGEPDKGLQEIFDLVSGWLPASQFDGQVSLFGEKLTSVNIFQLRRKKLAFIPARKAERGLITDFSIQENLLLTAALSGPWIWSEEAEKTADRLCNLMHVHADRLLEEVSNLSGGYQQRVLLAREFGLNPPLLVMHNPSQGIDISTRDELYEHVFEMQERLAAVLLISSDNDEVESLSTRRINLL